MNFEWLRAQRAEVRLTDSRIAAENEVSVRRGWNGNFMRATVKNMTAAPLRIKEVALFMGTYPVSDSCFFYAEGFQMLTEYTGTLEKPRVIGVYGADRPFFRIPENEFSKDFFTVYNCLYLEPAEGEKLLFAFTSSYKYSGEFRFKGSYIETVVDTEDRVLAPGEEWELDEYGVFAGPDRNELFSALSQRLCFNHPPVKFREIPFGWCSYHCINGVTADEMYGQAAALKQRIPELKRIQIDDGYQSTSDWLIPNPKAGAPMKEMCEHIRALGAEPAGYLAPFIVDKDSELFRAHPDWVVCDEHGVPFHKYTHVDKWYMLDGSNPDAVSYIRHVVRTMHDEWGIRYFKLDFTSYGALPGGRRHNNMTRIESFRALFGAITDEVGADSYILGCNAPFWPQLGLVHGNRETNDIFRCWDTVKELGEQLFWRSWQNGTLWYNDPDGVVLEKRDMSSIRNGRYMRRISELSDAEFGFHRAYIVACGGVVTSGDLISGMSEESLDILRTMMRETGTAAVFDDTKFTVGRIHKPDHELICVFNWKDEPADITVKLDGTYRISELFTGKDLGTHAGEYIIKDAFPHEGFVLKLIKR